MQVFKFGGASISTVERCIALKNILQQQPPGPLMIVMSAMGKTTNALEKVAEAWYHHRQAEALQLFEQVKQQHITLAKYLLVTEYNACTQRMLDFFTEAEWLLHDRPTHSYDYYYDQIVCLGEMLSTTILSHYLTQEGLPTQWIDVRDLLRTDSNFRDATVNWEETTQLVHQSLAPALHQGHWVLTQGFVGSTTDNESTTLGREGSDYTAAIFAHILEATSLTIWKDVPSVMNADPRLLPDAQPLPRLSYAEVLEMAYYGAQVIHPKTIKPLYQKGIPLYVKCFLDTSLPGTIITSQAVPQLPPIYVVKPNQTLMQFTSRQCSFIGEHAIGQILQLLEAEGIKPNLSQNGAVAYTAIAAGHRPHKLQHIALQAEQWVDVSLLPGLELLTVRHYTHAAIERQLMGRSPLLVQQTPDTWQAVVHPKTQG